MKILLADDSMTAQNMGKKILSEAGYDVVAVSNGAQAVKKIASEKPDVAVLDVYMPGYTGLEVCERVKNAQETAKIPVLLTVGKMEPFKPEDGNRVHADGVIVKPFEATDLLAAVQKLADQVAPAAASAAAASPQRTTEAISPPDFIQDSSYEEWKVSAPEHVEEVTTGPAPTRIEVPNEFAAAPAFGDFVSDDTPAPAQDAAPSDHRTEIMDQPVIAEAAIPVESPEIETATPSQFAEPSPFGLTPANPAFGQAFAPPSFDETQSIPVQPETPAEHHEVEFTSAPRAHEVEHTVAPGFEPTVSQEDHPVSDFRDPALVTDATELSKFTTKFGRENDEEIPVGIYTAPEEHPVEAASDAPIEPAPEIEEQPAAVEPPPVDHALQMTDEPAPVEAAPEPAPADFESRVAAAMSSYESAPEAVSAAPVEEHVEPPAPEPVASSPPPAEPMSSSGWTAHETMVGALEGGLSLHEEMQKAFAAAVPEEPEPAPVAEAPAPPPEPAPAADSHEALVAEMAAAIAAKEPEPAPAPEHAMAAAAGASIAEAFDNPRAGSVVLEPGALASIIHRVVERLKPELAAEIEKEIVEETKRKK